MRAILLTAPLAFLVLSTHPVAAADRVLKASHQWPGAKGDIRDEMLRILVREVEKAEVGLKIRLYPDQSLFKAKGQWGALVKGQLDISAFPIDYAAGRHPQFSATLMPGRNSWAVPIADATLKRSLRSAAARASRTMSATA